MKNDCPEIMPPIIEALFDPECELHYYVGSRRITQEEYSKIIIQQELDELVESCKDK